MAKVTVLGDDSGLRLYNSRITDTYIKYLNQKYPGIDTNELLRSAGMEPYQVADESEWFTQEQVDLLHDALVSATGNVNIAREAGRYAASPDALGFMRQYLLGFIGPSKAYEMVGRYASNFTRSSLYESRKTGSRTVEITVRPYPGAKEKPFQCENRTGMFEAIATIFKFRLPEIHHRECIFKGGKCCRYEITWRPVRSSLVTKARNYAGLFLTGACSVSFLFLPSLTLTLFLPIMAFVILSFSYAAIYMERQELRAAAENLRGSTEKLLQQLKEDKKHQSMMNEVGTSLSKHAEIDSILEKISEILQKSLDFDRGMIFLANEDQTFLNFRAGYGYSEEHYKLIKDLKFNLLKPESKGVFVLSFREKRSYLINNIDAISGSLSPRSISMARKLGAQSFICSPIVFEDESIGVVAVDNIRSKRPLLQNDLNVMLSVTPSLGISIKNAQLLEHRESQFNSLLTVLAASIDARDSLTAGHSEKVTEYALGICKEIDTPGECSDLVRVSAQLHDYGKIAVPDTILKKPGRLTDEERREVMKHAEKTKEILEKVDFKNQYKDVPDIVWSHHEKFDGSGYPRGLRGENIPLGARIIAVADVFEALTSKRHYRDPMPLEEALSLLRNESGTTFDPVIVKAFISYYSRTYSRQLQMMTLNLLGSPDSSDSY
jgi:HD-GYP domain-containing protein (c-di-GMP phosphodiesterase class II)